MSAVKVRSSRSTHCDDHPKRKSSSHSRIVQPSHSFSRKRSESNRLSLSSSLAGPVIQPRRVSKIDNSRSISEKASNEDPNQSQAWRAHKTAGFPPPTQAYEYNYLGGFMPKYSLGPKPHPECLAPHVSMMPVQGQAHHKGDETERHTKASKLNVAALRGSLDEHFNQQWNHHSRRERNRYAYLQGLTFIDWQILKPAPVEKPKKAKRMKAMTPSEEERQKSKNVQKNEEEAKRMENEAKLEARKDEIRGVMAKCGGSTLSIEQAAICCRQLGVAPGLEDLEQMNQQFGGRIDEKALLELMAKAGSYSDVPDDLITFLAMHDRSHTGFVSKAQLRNLLTTYGEPLTQQEFDCLMDTCGLGSEDQIDYRAFVNQLMVDETNL